MLKVFLTRADKEKGVWLSLPATPADVGEAYASMDNMGGTENSDTRVTEVKCFIPNLQQYLVGKSTDDPSTMKELDFIARRIGGLTDSEAALLSGALDIEPTNTLADIINLTYNLDGYELYPYVSTANELGRYLVESGEMQIHESALPYIDYEKVAAEFEANNSGTYTDAGYVVKTGEDIKQVYGGITLPDMNAGKEYIFSLKLMSQFRFDAMEDPYTLKLPTTDAALRDARDQLRVKHFDECEIEDCDCHIEGLSKMLPMDGDIHLLNGLAQIVKEMQSNDAMITKLLAALEAEKPEEMSAVLEIAEKLDRYELIPSTVANATDYAYFVLFESGRYDIYIDDEINSFVDYEKYGHHKMKEDGVKQTSFGMLRRIQQAELQTIKFYSPLFIKTSEPHSYDMCDLSSTDAVQYMDEILAAIEKEKLPSEGRKGLMTYFDRDEALAQKVLSANPMVEEYKGAFL
ncbi:antirestriction protein ArdA [Anaerosolibacter sp.]|uniref:antirestriction protein ArdA n=1 Tax=Anaerosolibacter sp. TaxID=1872527 RepID=UPI0039EEB43E